MQIQQLQFVHFPPAFFDMKASYTTRSIIL
jgi:hypothetical protein